jgi:hypothetical protein
VVSDDQVGRKQKGYRWDGGNQVGDEVAIHVGFETTLRKTQFACDAAEGSRTDEGELNVVPGKVKLIDVTALTRGLKVLAGASDASTRTFRHFTDTRKIEALKAQLAVVVGTPRPPSPIPVRDLSGRTPRMPARDGLTDRVEAGREGSRKAGRASQSKSHQSRFDGVWQSNTREPNCAAGDKRL